VFHRKRRRATLGRTMKGPVMIILGVILLILGFVFGIPILWTIGIIVIVAGAVLTILGATGRAIGGRKTWY
jgi:VIT1/CCC1 family predicted Fe2+/Mn2+ transporter